MILAPLAALLLSLPEPGNPAPEFTTKDQTGHTISLQALRGKPVVLYFYPMDQTPGCTVEARGFRDAHADYDKLGAVVLGVSTQDLKSHREFAKTEHLDFSLLDDHKRTIAKAYGVGTTPVVGLDDRVTILIDRQGIVRKVWPHVSPKIHSAEVLAAIRELPAS